MKELMGKKKELIIGVVVVLLIILLLFVFVFNKGGSENENVDNANTDNTTEKDTGITDKDIEKAYGFSGDDAIKLVKTVFDSDAFTYTAEATNESKYIVTCKSKIDETVLKFEVDPVTKSYYEIK